MVELHAGGLAPTLVGLLPLPALALAGRRGLRVAPADLLSGGLAGAVAAELRAGGLVLAEGPGARALAARLIGVGEAETWDAVERVARQRGLDRGDGPAALLGVSSRSNRRVMLDLL